MSWIVEWRAVAADLPNDDPDEMERRGLEFGRTFRHRSEAEEDLERILAESQPPYDRGWIERRTVSAWGRAYGTLRDGIATKTEG